MTDYRSISGARLDRSQVLFSRDLSTVTKQPVAVQLGSSQLTRFLVTWIMKKNIEVRCECEGILDDIFDPSPYTPSFLSKIKCCVDRLRPPALCGLNAMSDLSP